MFQRAPQTLDENVVDPAALAVHRDLDCLSLKSVRPALAGVLTALVGVENLWPTVRVERVLQGLQTELHVLGRRQAPRQHAPCMPLRLPYSSVSVEET